MKSGKLALLDSSTQELQSDYIEYDLPENSPFDTVKSTLQVEDTITLNDSISCFVGRAAKEDVERVETSKVDGNGKIVESETAKKITQVTSFLLVPDAFVIVNDSSGEFLFSLLTEQTGHTAFPAEISVDGFAADHDEAEYWKVGFEGRGDGAENGVLHGDAVLNDTEFGNIVGVTDKNQLGVDLEYRSDLLKLFLTESGYVELYQPSSFESDEFAELVLDVLLNYTRMK